MRFRKVRKSGLVLSVLSAGALLAASGCGDSTAPADEPILNMQNIAGVYLGVTFTTEADGVVTDQLRRGATIQLILYSSGTTDGSIYIPPEDSGCCEVNSNLNGIWSLAGDQVTLSLAADLFLNGMVLTYDQAHLTGLVTRDDVTYRVVLAL